MAVHISNYPYDFERNKAYLYILKHPERTSWDQRELQSRAGREFVHQLVKTEILIPGKNDILRLSFTVPGTPSSLICKLVEHRIYSFIELKSQLPRSAKCTSSKLKALLAFLANFHKIQYFTCPMTGLTVIVDDREELDAEIDEWYALTENVEQDILYKPESIEITFK